MQYIFIKICSFLRKCLQVRNVYIIFAVLSSQAEGKETYLGNFGVIQFI